MSGEAMFAVVVRDPDNLFLFLRVRRAPSGVYVLFPRDPDWDPHISYHTSGRYHHKSFRHRVHLPVQQRQPLDLGFRGTEHMVLIPIDVEGVRAVNAICRVEQFSQLFEIPVEKLGPTLADSRTSLVVDLAEPGSPPHEAVPGGHVVDQRIFDDAVPHICLTLWEEGEAG